LTGSAEQFPMYGGILEIDLDALADNWRSLDRLSGKAETAAVLKANAYGTGIEMAGPALHAAGCRTFFVALPEEGIRLRAVLPTARIFILHGLFEGAEELYCEHRLIPLLNTLDEIARWQITARMRNTILPAAIHLDTGMTRLGLDLADVLKLQSDPSRLTGIDVSFWASHLACGDEPDHAMNAAQLRRFNAMRAMVPAAPGSLANSAGIHLGADYHFDLVRPGIALYGGNPTPDPVTRPRPVVHLKARILQVHSVSEPETVGYGATHTVSGRADIATVSVGYADGYLRALGGKGYGMIGDKRVPIAGRVSMDLITFDVTAIPAEQRRPGQWISLIGGGVELDDLAACAGTIAYELLTGLGARYQRIYRGGAETT